MSKSRSAKDRDFIPHGPVDPTKLGPSEARAARRLALSILDRIARIRSDFNEVNAESSMLYLGLGLSDETSKLLAGISSAVWDLVGTAGSAEHKPTSSRGVDRLTRYEADLRAYLASLPPEEGPLEIERRFLLIGPPRVTGDRSFILQGYVDGDDVTRYRLRSKDGIVEHTRTVKKEVSYGVCVEVEEPFSREEFQKIVFDRMISKHRTVWKGPDGNTWEIDEMHVRDEQELRMIIAEVELPSIDAPLLIPEEIKAVLVMEITGMRQFSNYNLAKKSQEA